MQAVKYAREVKSASNRGKYNHLNSLDTIHSAPRKKISSVFITSCEKRRRTPGELGIAYVNPAQCDETLLILYEEKLFFVLSVAIIRPSTLLGDEDVGNGKLIPHLSNEKTACHNSLALRQPHSVTAVES